MRAFPTAVHKMVNPVRELQQGKREDFLCPGQFQNREIIILAPGICKVYLPAEISGQNFTW